MDAAEQRNTCGWSCINITFDHPFYTNAREVVLAEGACSPLSDGVIRLGGFHFLLSSMRSAGTIVAGNGTDAFSIRTSIHHLNETIGIRVYLLSERALATLLQKSSTIGEKL